MTLDDISIDALGVLSFRIERCLKDENVYTLGDLDRFPREYHPTYRGHDLEAALLRIPSFGRKSLRELKDALIWYRDCTRELKRLGRLAESAPIQHQ